MYTGTMDGDGAMQTWRERRVLENLGHKGWLPGRVGTDC